MKNILKNNKMLNSEKYTWEDIIVFLMDEYLLKMLMEMFSEGHFPDDTTENDVYILKEYIEEKFEDVIY